MSKRIALRILIPLFVLAGWVGIAGAQDGNSVKGKVVGAQGKPVSSIIVSVEDGLGTLVAQVATNNEGDFFVGGLKGGSYYVIVAQPGYELVREQVQFVVDPDADRPGENQFLHVTLVPKPGTPGTKGSGTVFVQNVPQGARDAFARGAQLSHDNKPAEAAAAFREAIAAFADYFDAHVALANELIKTNDLGGATKELDAANRANPKDPRVYAMFGSVLSRLKKYAVAAAAYGEAARLDPNEAQYSLLRATALIDQAAALDPSKPEVAKTRTDLLAAAAQDLDRSFEVSGKSLATVHLQRARLFERQGNKKGAADELDAYLKAVPNAPNAAAIRETVNKLRAG